MKIKTKIREYKIPDIHQVCLVAVRTAMVDYRLCQIAISEMFKLSNVPDIDDVLGMPTMFAVNMNRLYLWPIPDKPYEMIVRYLPPMKEI